MISVILSSRVAIDPRTVLYVDPLIDGGSRLITVDDRILDVDEPPEFLRRLVRFFHETEAPTCPH